MSDTGVKDAAARSSVSNDHVDAAVAHGERAPCPHCGAMIMRGALKCRGCRQWLGEPPSTRKRTQRSLTLMLTSVVAVAAVLLSQRQSPVGEAPPLTRMPAGAASVEVAEEPSPAALGPDHAGPDHADPNQPGADSQEIPTEALDAIDPTVQHWNARELPIDVPPIDVAFTAGGKSVLVSGHDASLREYDIATGKIVHMATMPARGDRLRLLGKRYAALIRPHDNALIPVMDTHDWDRDPMLLPVGYRPADIVLLPDGKTVVTASSSGKRLSWFNVETGDKLADIKLPNETHQLFVVRAKGRPYVGAMGKLVRAGRPAGAWLDLFDPSEEPFGATRRSIAVGRDPRGGTVARDGSAILYVDRIANEASLLEIDGSSTHRSVTVGQGPSAAFLMNSDRHGVTLDQKARTATVIDIDSMQRKNTLMLNGTPRVGAASPDGRTLFVSLGGTRWPPRESGAAVIAGDPPKVVATLDTGRGASRVASAHDGRKAVVANFLSQSLTIIRAEPPASR